MNIGMFGDEIGVCPLCQKKVVRGRYNYGCSGYAEGCKFRIPLSLCKRPVPVTAAKALLENGKTAKLDGFVSKNGKFFSASLKLNGDKVEFDF
jgi:DNA topoisomerase-3